MALVLFCHLICNWNVFDQYSNSIAQVLKLSSQLSEGKNQKIFLDNFTNGINLPAYILRQFFVISEYLHAFPYLVQLINYKKRLKK